MTAYFILQFLLLGVDIASMTAEDLALYLTEDKKFPYDDIQELQSELCCMGGH